MTVEPLVTVVVPAFNAGAYLLAALASVQAQSFSSWECIIVDDGSTDDTAGIASRAVEQDPRFAVISQPNGGISAARNAGIAAAAPSSVYLAFLDADDTWRPAALQTLLDAAAANPAAVGVYGLAEYMDQDGTPTRPGEHPASQRDRREMGRLDLGALPADAPSSFASLIVSGTMWPSAILLHRRDAITRVSGFDPEISVAEDWELYVRMSRSGDFIPVQEQVAWYRQHDANVTRRLHAIAYFSLLVRYKMWISPDNTAAQRRQIRRVWCHLLGRWLIWTAGAAVQATRTRHRADCTAALRACVILTRRLATGHPVQPDQQFAGIVTRYVTTRWAGLQPDADMRPDDERP